jgi:ABC-type transporter MlaC component
VNLRLIVTILVIAAAPRCAQAQKPTPAKVTKADAQKVLKIISSDKAKTRIYCEMAKLGAQMEQANETGDSEKFDKLFQRIYELGKKTGSRIYRVD